MFKKLTPKKCVIIRHKDDVRWSNANVEKSCPWLSAGEWTNLDVKIRETGAVSMVTTLWNALLAHRATAWCHYEITLSTQLFLGNLPGPRPPWTSWHGPQCLHFTVKVPAVSVCYPVPVLFAKINSISQAVFLTTTEGRICTSYAWGILLSGRMFLHHYLLIHSIWII